jgi:hypothetical protein
MTDRCALARPHARSDHGGIEFFAPLFLSRKKVEKTETCREKARSKDASCLTKKLQSSQSQNIHRKKMQFLKLHLIYDIVKY